MSAGRAMEALVADPGETGGVVLRAGAGPARDLWLKELRARLPRGTRVLRLPPGITADRLLGGMDLGATLAAGHPVVRSGLLADADGAILVVPMAERLPPSVTSALLDALDTGHVRLERDGASALHPARFVPVFLDESEEDEDGVPDALVDRVGPVVDLHPRWTPASDGMEPVDPTDNADPVTDATPPAPSARPTLPDDASRAVVEAAAALGISSLRPALRTLAVARALARGHGMDAVDEVLLGAAAALVLGPRALTLPPAPQDEDEEEQAPPEPLPEAPPPAGDSQPESDTQEMGTLADRVLEAVRPALPPRLLASMAMVGAARQAAAAAGKAGEERRQPRHGRSAGARPGDPRRGGRVDLLATLRAAAPWQPIRKRMDPRVPAAAGPDRLRIRRDDLRIQVLVRRASTTAIFVVDASGSQALNRLAEAKGAVELLLAESYVRREAVALVAFRGKGAELILPPTRALVRARRALAGLPGGGGTPLASGVEVGLMLAERVRREGSAPVLVVLTDGRANVARDGTGGRERAEADARTACRAVAHRRIPALFVDSSPRGTPAAVELARLMGGRYLRLPTSDPRPLTAAVRATGAGT